MENYTSAEADAQFVAGLVGSLRERAPEYLTALDCVSNGANCALFDRLFLEFDLRASQRMSASLADGREVGALYLVPVIREGCPAALRAVYRDLGGVHAGAPVE